MRPTINFASDEPSAGRRGAVENRQRGVQPDGNTIVSGSADETERLWPGYPDAAAALCAKLTTDMGHEQWRDWVSPDIGFINACPGLPISAEPWPDARGVDGAAPASARQGETGGVIPSGDAEDQPDAAELQAAQEKEHAAALRKCSRILITALAVTAVIAVIAVIAAAVGFRAGLAG